MREKYGFSQLVDANLRLPSVVRRPVAPDATTEQAIEHFEAVWGGYLPATPSDITKYLVSYAGKLATSVLKLHVAALSRWHLDQGYADPTNAVVVHDVLKGIRTLHPDPAPTKLATPTQLDQLELVHCWMAMQARVAEKADDRAELLRCRRDIALLLIGFWRGFNGDQLSRLRVEHIQYEPRVAIRVYLPRVRAGRRFAEQAFSLPALNRLCPVQAYADWLDVADITHGPVFQAINRWGKLSETALTRQSMTRVLQSALKHNVPTASRGISDWVFSCGWNLHALMNYVGWQDERSALPYLDSTMSFGGLEDNPSWVTVRSWPKHQ
ncbi:TPA: hypothetical protein ACXLB5_005084 [Pseudomonas aeruginosa]|uniref:Recombinase n=1 Tax=Pseudomonas tohonis TaxID=2725477 RepID=A0A6J4E7Q7_9PSED|nr:hypothetical protein [Pseudomonas tohonis]BCG24974.1 recombinase [Pseudomonas tohonis]GJN53787.1 recombinase [Pseudomonas tohonis]